MYLVRVRVRAGLGQGLEFVERHVQRVAVLVARRHAHDEGVAAPGHDLALAHDVRDLRGR